MHRRKRGSAISQIIKCSHWNHVCNSTPFEKTHSKKTTEKLNQILEQHQGRKPEELMKKCCHFGEECDRMFHCTPEETANFSSRKAQISKAYQVR